jgi:acyl-coenzyme A synthetase/AMP-(fatty) acid ligase
VLLSARLSATAVVYLLERTSAKSVIASKALQSTAKEAVLISKRDDETAATLYSPNPYDLYLENGLIAGDNKICDPNHYIDKNDRNVLILHSSGTTGLPKPIYTSHEYWMGYATCHDFKTAEEAAGLSATTLPLYHVSSINLFLGYHV